MEWLLAFLAGVVIAAVTTPVGVSGAVFLLPFQLSILGVPSPSVTPTNLVYNVVSVPGGLARYRRHGSLRSPLTREILIGTLPGVVAGALLRVFFLPDGFLFRLLVAFLLLPLGLWLMFGRQPQGDRERPHARVVIGLGLGAGLIGGIYGIGGGALMAPLLVALGGAVRLVAPATLLATFVTSVVGAGTYVVLALLGHPQASPHWGIALSCGVGGLLGGYLGAAMAPRLPAQLLRRGLGMVSVALAAAYVVAVLR